MKAICVKVYEAEKIRKKILPNLDTTRKFIRKGDLIEIPVKDSFKSNEYKIIEQSQPEFYRPEKTLKDVVNIPENYKKFLPSGWQIIGDIIIVSLNKNIEKYKHDIGNALLTLYPRCRTVLQHHEINGIKRVPYREIIAGDKNTVTLNREVGCVFSIDTMKLMYSKGNLEEKKYMSRLGNNEVVIDMFAGIGYFSIPMAVHSKPKKIIAIEINPLAFKFLKKNIKLNKVENIIHAIHGNCAFVTPVRVANRVIMGYLTGYKYLKYGIKALLPNGILHYHESVPQKIINRPVKRVISESEKLGKKAHIIQVRKVKKYSPGVLHIVVDAKIKDNL